MNTDTAIIKGKTHHICEDYALAGDNYIIISDGCSGSKDTDCGNRILLKTFENYIKRKIIDLDSPKKAIYKSRKLIKILQLEEECLDATLFCTVKNNDFLNVFCAGDGAVLFVYKNDKIILETIEYNNYPFYLNYLFNNARLKEFQKIKPESNINSYLLNKDYNIIRKNEKSLLSSYSNYFFAVIPENQIKQITIFTDGIKSFVKKNIHNTFKNEEKLDYKKIIKQLVDFKSTTGFFVKRKLNRFIKANKKEEIINMDDFTMATIHI